MRVSIPIAAPISILVLMALFLIYMSCETSQESSEVKSYANPPSMAIDTTKDFFATFEMEDGGQFIIELYDELAPNTVNNFVFLANKNYYNGTTFHRVIDGFMAQGGDPSGTGSGSPGYYFENEFHVDARHNSAGVLSMANKGLVDGKGTNGSQFFITFSATEFLDGFDANDQPKDCALDSCHSVFGKVVNGMDVVTGLSIRDPESATKPGDAIKTVTITTRESN
jgi:cyclophilin family peptidyl-prolyl cis-trans isomerase